MGDRVQTLLEIDVRLDPNGQWYVHVRKGSGCIYGHHPILTATEAEWAARDIANASAECRRRNVTKRL